MSVLAEASAPYKTVAQIAEKYGLSDKTVRRRCSRTVNPWPCHQEFKGAAVRFSPEDEAAIEQLMRPAAQVLGVPAPTVTPAQLKRIGKKLLRPAGRAG